MKIMEQCCFDIYGRSKLPSIHGNSIVAVPCFVFAYRWLSHAYVVVVSILKPCQQLCDNCKMAIAVCSCIFVYLNRNLHSHNQRIYHKPKYKNGHGPGDTSHHKYIQLSGSNLAIPIFSTMGHCHDARALA